MGGGDRLGGKFFQLSLENFLKKKHEIFVCLVKTMYTAGLGLPKPMYYSSKDIFSLIVKNRPQMEKFHQNSLELNNTSLFFRFRHRDFQMEF